MKALLVVLVLTVSAAAQSFRSTRSFASRRTQPASFLDVRNLGKYGILAGLVAADAIGTQRGLEKGLSRG